MAKKKKVVSRPRAAGKTTEMRKEAIAQIEGYDWDVIYGALRARYDELRHRGFHGYPRDREASYQDIMALERLMEKVGRIANIGKPKPVPFKL